jgi:hypothetical protein
MPLPFPPDSQMFEGEQRIEQLVEYWHTPFSPIRNDQASGGIRFTLKEPVTTTAAWNAYVNTVRATSAYTATQGAFTSTPGARNVVLNGRLANLVQYWAGGAPGHHGASVSKRLAYRFEGWLRAGSGRDWFDPSTSFTATIGVAGHGHVKVYHNSDLIINTDVSELQWLESEGGGPMLSAARTFTTGDKLDIYYIQNDEPWGGYVFKMIPGTVPDSQRARLLAMREGAVIGCGLIDDHLGAGAMDVTKRTLTYATDLEVQVVRGQAERASFRVPLVNPAQWDGIGWQWVRDLGEENGHLQLNDFVDDGFGGVTPLVVDVLPGRLVRLKGGFREWQGGSEIYPMFTGVIDDFEGQSSGIATVRCVSLGQPLAEQYVKNYPDKISYMTYGYQRLRGTSEPVYDTTAYDNWPLEYVIRDLLTRTHIDESRTRAPLLVPQPDGTAVAVEM